MRKAALIIVSILIGVWTASAARAQDVLDRYKPGQAFGIEIDLPLFSMPLPRGTWKVVYAHQWSDNNKNKLIELMFVADRSELTQFLVIKTNVNAVSSGWVTTDLCGRQDIVHNVVTANQVGLQDCYGVNHYVWKETSDFTPTKGMNLQKFVQSQGGVMPHMTMAKFVRLANASAFITMIHHEDTAALKVKDLKVGWNESLWHKDRIGNDQQRLVIADQLREEALDWHLRAKLIGYF